MKECKNKREGNFAPPKPEDITAYCKNIGYELDPDTFISFYAARGWKYKGGIQMKDWKAAIRTWRNRDTKTQADDRKEKEKQERLARMNAVIGGR